MMALRKEVEVGRYHPFCAQTHQLIDYYKKDNLYVLNPEVARQYHLAYHYFSLHEPHHPLLQEITETDREYRTLDAIGTITDATTKSYIDLMRGDASWNAFSQLVPIKQTPLLDYLIDTYGKGIYRRSYYATSRRKRLYDFTHVEMELYPLFEALRLNTRIYKDSNRFRAWSVKHEDTIISLRTFFKDTPVIYRFSGDRHPFFSKDEELRMAALFRNPISRTVSAGGMIPDPFTLDVYLADWKESWQKKETDLLLRTPSLELTSYLKKTVLNEDLRRMDRFNKTEVALLRNYSTINDSSRYSYYIGNIDQYSFQSFLMESGYRTVHRNDSYTLSFLSKELSQNYNQPFLPKVKLYPPVK